MTQSVVVECDGGVRLRVRAKPRASRSRVLGVREDALDVALAAPPVDGEANGELCRTIARCFGVAPSAVTLVLGHRSRTKLVRITGVTLREATAALGL